MSQIGISQNSDWFALHVDEYLLFTVYEIESAGKLGKSEMNCIATQKCTESQKLDTKTHHITRVKSNNIYIFAFFVLAFILCDTRKASENRTFVLKEILILSSACVISVTPLTQPDR